METEKLSESEKIRIPPVIRESMQIREALNRRIMAGVPVIEEDGWKYASEDKAFRNITQK